MEAVPLNPGDYPGSYKLVGGQVSLDFINTVSWPGGAKRHDWLDRVENVTAWAVAAGLIEPATRVMLDAKYRTGGGKELAEVRRLRDQLDDVLRPLASHASPPEGAVGQLTTLVHQVSSARRIDPDSCRWVWDPPGTLPGILAPVIWNAAQVLTELDHTRLGRCGSCDWLFYDATRNRSRRWCDMADCGSRDKALRYYHRTRQEQ